MVEGMRSSSAFLSATERRVHFRHEHFVQVDLRSRKRVLHPRVVCELERLPIPVLYGKVERTRLDTSQNDQGQNRVPVRSSTDASFLGLEKHSTKQTAHLFVEVCLPHSGIIQSDASPYEQRSILRFQ